MSTSLKKTDARARRWPALAVSTCAFCFALPARRERGWRAAAGAAALGAAAFGAGWLFTWASKWLLAVLFLGFEHVAANVCGDASMWAS